MVARDNLLLIFMITTSHFLCIDRLFLFFFLLFIEIENESDHFDFIAADHHSSTSIALLRFYFFFGLPIFFFLYFPSFLFNISSQYSISNLVFRWWWWRVCVYGCDSIEIKSRNSQSLCERYLRGRCFVLKKREKKSHLFIEKFRVIFNKLPCHAYGSSHIFRYFTMFISFYYNHYLCAHIWIDLEKIVFLFIRFILSLISHPIFIQLWYSLLCSLSLFISHLFTRALCHCSMLLPSMPMGYVRRIHAASRMQSSKVFELAAYSMFFPCLYIRFNPFLCYSISVNLLSVQWQRKINVISMFYR